MLIRKQPPTLPLDLDSWIPCVMCPLHKIVRNCQYCPRTMELFSSFLPFLPPPHPSPHTPCGPTHPFVRVCPTLDDLGRFCPDMSAVRLCKRLVQLMTQRCLRFHVIVFRRRNVVYVFVSLFFDDATLFTFSFQDDFINCETNFKVFQQISEGTV